MSDWLNRSATYADLKAVPEHLDAEIIDGTVVTHHGGRPLLAFTRTSLIGELWAAARTSGWLLLHKSEVHHDGNVLVPDVAAWFDPQIYKYLDAPWSEVPTPDWVCEIISDETVRFDRGRKRSIYAEAGVSHLWLVDPDLALLEAFTRTPAKHWVLDDTIVGDGLVRLSPFDKVSFRLSDLWSLDAPARPLNA